MISTVSELDVTREQLFRAESALEIIYREIRPVNEERYRLMAESYIEQIQLLRAQIDSYFEIDKYLVESANLVISLEGKNVRPGEIAVGVMTKTLDAFRRGIQSLVQFESQRSNSRRKKRWIEQLCDLPLIAMQAGSVRFILGEPDTGSLFNDEDQLFLKETLGKLFSALEWISNEHEESPSKVTNDPELWELTLRVLRNLLPPRNSPVESIGFYGSSVGGKKPLQLHQSSRQRLNQVIGMFENVAEYTEIRGIIREVDLDKRVFTLRDRPEAQPDIECEYDESLESSVKTYLDELVIVTGVLKMSRKSKKQTLEVEAIEPDLVSDVDSSSNGNGVS